MEEKKEIKISLTSLLLAVSIFAIIVLVFYICIEKVNNNQNTNSILGTSNYENIKDSVYLENDDLESNKVFSDNTSSKTDIKDNIILYKGYEIEQKYGVQSPVDMDVTDETMKKYNTTYYNYENGKYQGTSVGDFGEETYEGVSAVDNVSRIAMTKKYDAIPRDFENIEELPEQLMEMADCTNVDIQSIDLDNDGKKEYILCYKFDYAKGDIGDGEPQASSGIMLLDSNYKKIADLVSLENGFWAGFKEEDRKIFISIDDVDYIDIDNDGVMEIIIKVPEYDATTISIIKYLNGKIEGETDIKASVMP